jgi:hypothetical protein
MGQTAPVLNSGTHTADQHRNQQQALRARQPLGQCQAYERIEAKGHLRAGRVVAPVDVPADQRQVGQAVRQRYAGDAQQQPRTDQAGRRGQVQRALHDGVEQQHRKQEVVHQAFHLLPHGAVQRGVPAYQVAAKDQRKVGEKQLRVVHPSENTCCLGVSPYV